MVLMALFTTFLTTPLVTALYKPARRSSPYKHRTIQRKNTDSQLRILACLHSNRNVPTIINLIEASRGTRTGRRPVLVYAMHLMELSERPSAILMVHKARNNGLPFWNKVRRDSDQIVVAFEAYHRLSSVSIRPMTAISDLTDMHEDICTSAEQKRAAMIVLPYHKQQRLDGSLEPARAGFHSVNLRVLQNAPCSVGVLVDRGFGGTTQVSASDVSQSMAVFFFGGPDDREALAYGCRMAEHPGINLTVVRFIVPEPIVTRQGSVRIVIDHDNRNGDEEFLAEFKGKLFSSESIDYLEKEVASKPEIMALIKEHSRCDLILVGRSAQCESLTEKTDSPELGPVGSLLVSPEFPVTASVLVVQQYNKMSAVQCTEDSVETPRSTAYDSESA